MFLPINLEHPSQEADLAHARAMQEPSTLADYDLPSVTSIERLWAKDPDRLPPPYRKRWPRC